MLALLPTCSCRPGAAAPHYVIYVCHCRRRQTLFREPPSSPSAAHERQGCQRAEMPMRQDTKAMPPLCYTSNIALVEAFIATRSRYQHIDASMKILYTNNSNLLSLHASRPPRTRGSPANAEGDTTRCHRHECCLMKRCSALMRWRAPIRAA